MKSDNLAAVEFIRACALANKHVRDFSNAVRGMAGVLAVSASQDMFGQDEQEWPESPIGVAWYVDAELDDGSVVCWVLDVTWEKSTWTISRELTVPGKHGPKTVRTFEERSTSQLSECISSLLAQSKAMTATASARVKLPASGG